MDRGQHFGGLIREAILKVLEEMGETVQAENRKIYRACIMTTLTSEAKPNMKAAFLRYLDVWEPYGLQDKGRRQKAPRYIALMAYDFAFWMGIFGKLTPEDGSLLGDL